MVGTAVLAVAIGVIIVGSLLLVRQSRQARLMSSGGQPHLEDPCPERAAEKAQVEASLEPPHTRLAYNLDVLAQAAGRAIWLLGGNDPGPCLPQQ